MKRHSLWILPLLLIAVISFTSCRKRQHLEVSKSLIVFGFARNTDVFNVEADCDWTVDTDNTEDWLTVSPLSGSNDSTVAVTVQKNTNLYDRNTTFAVVSENKKIRREITVAQSKIDINIAANKVWFLRTYERWDFSNYFNEIIPESYRSWIYYTNPGFENWFLYFQEDSTGYEVHTLQGDTVYYPYQYIYYPDGDSLYIVFQTINDTIEDYHAVIHELNNSNFSFSDEYDPYQFEKLNMVNVSPSKRNEVKINPKKIASKPKGPLIQLK